jgi:two-component system heavy metal sensor histidine kinase CusS
MVAERPAGTEVSVDNDGEDIDPQVLPRLFDRFYRADPARAHPTSDGAGLGLAITKAIVEAHGGLISVTSAQGVTCFSMVFPHSDE